jgi:membrane-bound lytic murein transglycosylase D
MAFAVPHSHQPPVRLQRRLQTGGGMRTWWARALAALLAAGSTLLGGNAATAIIKPRREPSADDLLFPKPPVVRRQVRFWELVFGKYPSTTVIVHDSNDPDRIIDLIDYRTFASRTNRDEPVPRKQRDDVTLKYLKRYTRAAERFAQEGDKARRYGAIEERLFTVYKDDPAALKKLYDGDIKIRAQTGLADDFIRAAATAQAYLPYMERVFAQYGIPIILSRLPFVESMFNVRARSKVGASGLWQFMPQTARNYVYVNSMVDERNSPFKATRAAAQFLQGNYRDLEAWPLAITAYNHGKMGMANAARQLGTRDIGAIIENYDSSSFGFASRNFYSEFLAAANTYDALVRDNRIDRKVTLPESESIVLKAPLSIDTLLKHTPLTRALLAEHNPCLLESTLTRNSAKPLPAFYELKVPRALVQATKTALDALKTRIYARR